MFHPIADYFVIVTGDSTPHVKALMETVKDKIKKDFARAPLRMENDAKNRWNLLDYGDVVVHILHKENSRNLCNREILEQCFFHSRRRVERDFQRIFTLRK